MADLGQAIQNMIDLCNDDSHGYSMTNRWGPDYDCSSSIITALRNADFDVGNASYTGNMSSELCARGWERLSAGVSKEPGDILLNDVNHVALYIGDGQLAEFSQDLDGVTGDSSGREAYVHGYYDYPWDCVLRWPEGVNKKVAFVKWIPA